MTPRGFYLDTGETSFFAQFHAPERHGGAAVLLVSPFGWDDVASYRPRFEWAKALAHGGHPVLRFDRPGTGDSPGGEEPDWLGPATEATAAAASWLRAESGERRVVAIGIGLGGILALRAVADGAPIDDLVLWAVPSSGRRFLRELRSAGRAEASLIGGPEAEGSDVTFGGYTIDAKTAAGLELLDLAQLPLPDCSGRRALVIGRDRIDPDRALVAALEQSGFDVTAQQGAGFADMTIQPNESRLSEPVARDVDAFLASLPAAPVAAWHGQPPAAAETATTDGIVERPLAIEQPFGSLAAVLSEPEADASDLTLVLLNAGGVRRSGPSRMWVEIARSAAARGTRAVRLDLEGIGDSDGDGTPYADAVALYTHALVDQVCATVTELAGQGLGSRFALLGLCSGAWWAFQGALADERVVGAIMLNPGTLFTADPRVEAARDARRIRRQLLQWSSWRRVLTGEIPFGRKRLVALLTVLVGRVVGRQPGDADLSERFASSMASIGDRARVTIGWSEGELLEEELFGATLDPATIPNLRIVHVSGRDHTFRPAAMRPQVFALVAEELERLAPVQVAS